MSELDAVFAATVEFKDWYAEFETRFQTVPKAGEEPGLAAIVESAALYGFLAARGLDMERALAEETVRLEVETTRLRQEREEPNA